MSLNIVRENANLKARITALESLLRQHNIPFDHLEEKSPPVENDSKYIVDPASIISGLPNVLLTSSVEEIRDCVKSVKNRTKFPSPYIQDHTLSPSEIHRYGRHLILPEVGVSRQEKWLQSSVLVIGAGGLGAPVCLYLAAAGVGHITVVDDDVVDVSNLQRQVIHNESTLGFPKALSAARAMAQLNSQVRVTPIVGRFTEENALSLCQAHDVVIDATDNVFTRYLLNDAAVIAGKPVVSGSALRTEGQLTLYGLPGGACYRCLYPTPPPPETVTNCSDGGVLGVVPGVIGTLQAMEALKFLADAPADELLAQRMLVFDGSSCTVRTVKLRGRNSACAVCGEQPSITAESLQAYQQVCSAAKHDKPAAGPEAPVSTSASATDDTNAASSDVPCPMMKRVIAGAVSIPEYFTKFLNSPIPDDINGERSLPLWPSDVNQRAGHAHLLLDVRDAVQHSICGLPGAVNFPYTQMKPRNMPKLRVLLWKVYEEKHRDSYERIVAARKSYVRGDFAEEVVMMDVITICRRGVYSRLACEALVSDATSQQAMKTECVDITMEWLHANILPPLRVQTLKGGLLAYHEKFDPSMPMY